MEAGATVSALKMFFDFKIQSLMGYVLMFLHPSGINGEGGVKFSNQIDVLPTEIT